MLCKMFSHQLLSNQAKAVMLIYLTMSAYAEQSLHQLAKRATINGDNEFAQDDPIVISNIEQRDDGSTRIQGTSLVNIATYANETDYSEATPLYIPYEGTEGCSTSEHSVFVEMDGETFELMTPNGTTLCNDADAHHVATKAFQSHDHLHKRLVLNPTIASFSVRLIGSTVFTGTVTLATVGTAALIGAALFGIWYGATKLAGKATESKRDVSSNLLPASRAARLADPDRAALAARSNKDFYVSFSDENQYTQSAVNEKKDKKRDKKGAKQCAKQIINKKVTGGCCTYTLVGSKGAQYVSQIGAAWKGSNDGTFNCWD